MLMMISQSYYGGVSSPYPDLSKGHVCVCVCVCARARALWLSGSLQPHGL